MGARHKGEALELWEDARFTDSFVGRHIHHRLCWCAGARAASKYRVVLQDNRGVFKMDVVAKRACADHK